MRDIRTRQQVQLSGECRKKRRRKEKRPADLLQEGGKTMGRVVDFFLLGSADLIYPHCGRWSIVLHRHGNIFSHRTSPGKLHG